VPTFGEKYQLASGVQNWVLLIVWETCKTTAKGSSVGKFTCHPGSQALAIKRIKRMDKP